MRNNELKHYGVLGMKWGIHRAEKRGENYTYKSHGQKKYEKKIAKEAKSDKGIREKTKNKLEMFKERDAGREAFARKTKVGYAVARGVIMGPIGAGNYNRLEAFQNGKNAALRKNAAVRKSMNFASAYVSAGLLNIGSILATYVPERTYWRKDGIKR